MKEIAKLGFILLLIGAIAASLLAVTYELTIDQILETRRIADETARKEVFPDAESFEQVSESKLSELKDENPAISDAYVALVGGNKVGFVVKTTPSGFGGPIDIVTGFTTDGIVTGMRMGNHTETPGLGANAKLPSYYDQYVGLNLLSTIGVSKTAPSDNEILAISGATITSKAVTDGVNFNNDIFSLLNE